MLFDPEQEPKLLEVAKWVKRTSYSDVFEEIRALEAEVEAAKERLRERLPALEMEVDEARARVADRKRRFSFELDGKAYKPPRPHPDKPQVHRLKDGLFRPTTGWDEETDPEEEDEGGSSARIEVQWTFPSEDPEEGVAEDIAAKATRSPVLIAAFVDGYALGWRFAVPEAFKEPLDIKRTVRSVKKRQEENWTQGRLFNFIPGSILYNTRLAYDLPWGEALDKIKLAVQVVESEPSKMVQSQLKKTERPVSFVKVKPGALVFNLFVPKKDPQRIVPLERITTDQEEFVGFLQTGLIRLKDSMTRDLFQEFTK